MVRSRIMLAAAILAAGGFVAPARASDITLRPLISQVYGLNDGGFLDFTPANPALFTLAGDQQFIHHAPGTPLVVQIDITMSIGDFQSGQLGFGNVAFGVSATGVASHVASNPHPRVGQPAEYESFTEVYVSPNYSPGPYFVSIPPDLESEWPYPRLPSFAANADFGFFTDDLQWILVEQVPTTFGDNDPRASLGVHAPVVFGSALLIHDGLQPGSVAINDHIEWSTYDETGTLIRDTTGQSFVDGIVLLNLIPEPAACLLLCLGMAWAILARPAKRTTIRRASSNKYALGERFATTSI